MSLFRPHGARVICVADPERDLPEAVQHWLGQGNLRPHVSPDVYDALAMLATGTRPVAMVVSCDALDWNEIEFFRHVGQLSRGTRVYVTSRTPADPRLQAAIERGARPFDPAAVQADLDAMFGNSGVAQTGGLLAGSLRPAHVPRTPINVPSPAPAAPVKPPPTPAADQPKAAPESPTIRLVTPGEPEGAEKEVEVSVPWTPHPSRPKRTPPKPVDTPTATAGRTGPDTPPGDPAAGRGLPRVDLSPEELAALLGKPAANDPGSAKEQRS